MSNKNSTPHSPEDIDKAIAENENVDIVKYVFLLLIYASVFFIMTNNNIQIIGFIVSFLVNLIISLFILFDLNTYLKRMFKLKLSAIKETKFDQYYIYVLFLGILANIIASLFMFITIITIINSYSTTPQVVNGNAVIMPAEITPKNQDSFDLYKRLFITNTIFIFALSFIVLFKSNNLSLKFPIIKQIYDIGVFNIIFETIKWFQPAYCVIIIAISIYLLYVANDLISMRLINIPIQPPPIITENGSQNPILPLSNKSWNLSLTDFVKKYMNPYYLSNYVAFTN
jgi:hypothetical protein